MLRPGMIGGVSKDAYKSDTFCLNAFVPFLEIPREVKPSSTAVSAIFLKADCVFTYAKYCNYYSARCRVRLRHARGVGLHVLQVASGNVAEAGCEVSRQLGKIASFVADF